MIKKNWQELIKPNKLQVTTGDDPKRVATVVAEPLERGFGTTLGNALRRVLLSSLQGAAVTSVQIDGVLHEFSSIPGVREDVTDIVLNIKTIAIRSQTDAPKRMTLRKTGPGLVTAGDIGTVGDIQILNPDLVICTLDDGAEIRMEFTVATGKGYVPAERNRPEDAPIGLIPVESLFSPVTKVSYRVETTREGPDLDKDKLTMTVETNGAVSPEDALVCAARIIQDQLQVFVSFKDPRKEETAPLAPQLPFNPALLKKVDELELSVRAANCLKNDNIVYIGDLIQKSEGEMLRTPNFGRRALNEIKEILAGMGLHLGMDIPGWPPENIERYLTQINQDDADDGELALISEKPNSFHFNSKSNSGPSTKPEHSSWRTKKSNDEEALYDLIERIANDLSAGSKDISKQAESYMENIAEFTSWARKARKSV